MQTTTPVLIEEICELLKGGLVEVFNTMFNLTAQPTETNDFRGNEELLVAGSVGITGEVNGVVYIYVRSAFARALTCQMVGIADEEIEGDEMVNDVIGELTNMVVGATKSRLCDSGSPCMLTIPSIVRGKLLRAEATCSSVSRVFSMACESESVLIELLMKPSN